MWLVFWAQAPPPPSGVDSIATWVQFGVLGAVVVAILRGWLWAKPAVDRLLRDLDWLREQREKTDEVVIAEIHALRSEIASLRKEVRRRDPPAP